MSIFKCKMCGGSLEIESGATVIECEYCGTQQTLPKLDDDKRANMYDRANHFRRNNEFDKAMGIYEQILNEDNTDAEAYWSLVLCRYGIEYVEDPSSHKRIPTVNRAQFTSIFDDDNYKSALQYADSYQRTIYEAEAKAINEIQKGILAISSQEEPFDVFICYKETDNNGRRTPDSVLANDLYHQLTQEGFKVFFARITLEDKLGSAYEPYIFAALNSAKVMVVLGTKPEFFNAVWVKNEWSRYLALIKQGQKKMLIPAYKDMDPYDLPEEFSHLQAQDMSKLGFMQDLIRGIKKIAKSDEPKTTVVKETVVTNATANTAPLIKRVFMFLEDSKWSEANEYCEKVLDVDPECADAYLGKLLAELKVQRKTSLEFYSSPFDHKDNYNKIVRFGNDALVSELKQYNATICERNEENRKAGIYNTGSALANHQTPEKQIEAAEEFEKIPGYRDADARAKNCRHQSLLLSFDIAMKAMKQSTTSQQYVEAGKLFFGIADGYAPAKEKAEECATKSKELAEIERKDAIYFEALNAMKKDDISSIEGAIKKFKSIIAWKDSEKKIAECDNKIAQIRAEEERIRIETEKAAKVKKKKITIATASIIGIILCIVLIVNISSYIKYKPLNEAFANDQFTVDFVTQNYDNLQNDKGALKIVAKNLNDCVKQNDLEKALQIISVLAQTDCAFVNSYYDSTSQKFIEYSSSIVGTRNFADWLYTSAKAKGKSVPKDGPDKHIKYIDCTYEVYGYKLSIQINVNNIPYGAYLYIPSVGWYEIEGNYEGSAAVIVK